MVEKMLSSFSCSAFLDEQGVMRKAHIRYKDDHWVEFHIKEPLSASPDDGYLAAMLPVEFHCHGMGSSDFSDFESLDLREVNKEAKEEGILCLLCMFLPHHKLESFIDFMHRYARLTRSGELSHLTGVALEGPLLASFGGTPERGMWVPTRGEWKKLCACGQPGLRYIVLSPDAMLEKSNLSKQFHNDLSIDWIISTLLEANIRSALGHFQKNNPTESAKCIETLLEITYKRTSSSFLIRVITDHLFNDMPLKFKHAWRTPKELERRPQEIGLLHLEQWNMENLDTFVGEVPATLMRAAHDGLVALCLNFDGAHVDAAVCQKVVELIDSKYIIAMTDRLETNRLGDQKLVKNEEINLWYQERGIVAAGCSTIDHQIRNLRALKVPETSIWNMTSLVPSQLLGLSSQYDEHGFLSRCCYVSPSGERFYIESDGN